MTLLIEDAKIEAAIHKLANMRKLSVTEAAGAAVEEALARDRRSLPVEERLKDIWAAVNSKPDTGVVLDKKFYDDLWGEDDLRGSEE